MAVWLLLQCATWLSVTLHMSVGLLYISFDTELIVSSLKCSISDCCWLKAPVNRAIEAFGSSVWQFLYHTTELLSRIRSSMSFFMPVPPRYDHLSTLFCCTARLIQNSRTCNICLSIHLVSNSWLPPAVQDDPGFSTMRFWVISNFMVSGSVLLHQFSIIGSWLNQSSQSFDQNFFLISFPKCMHVHSFLLHLLSNFQTTCTCHIKCHPLNCTKATRRWLIPHVFPNHISYDIVSAFVAPVAK